MQSKPQLLSWIMCDGVHIDPSTGKHTLLGVFSSIRAPRFPHAQPFMVWFLALSDCTAGEHHLRISMGLDPTSIKELIARPFPVHGPLQRINLVNEIRGLTFPEPGEYSLVVEVDDEPLLATNLSLLGPESHG